VPLTPLQRELTSSTVRLGAVVLSISMSILGCTAVAPEDARSGDLTVLRAAPTGWSAEHMAQTRGLLSSRFEALAEPVPGGLLTLRAHIERRTALDAQVRVQLVLPDGVELVEGHLDQWLKPSDPSVARELTFVVRVHALPTEDAVLWVDMQASAGGYHAQHPYRFGRSAPVPASPARTGPELKAGARRLGRSIRLRP
jgi:hypothetical protein